jgi:hypothetical protein
VRKTIAVLITGGCLLLGLAAASPALAKTNVLSQGMDKQLQVHPDTCRYLEQHSITVHVAETREAVRIYNDLTDGTLVAGLFHSIC